MPLRTVEISKKGHSWSLGGQSWLRGGVQEGVLVSLMASHPSEPALLEGVLPKARKRRRGNASEAGVAWGGFNAALSAALELDPHELLAAYTLCGQPAAVLLGVYRGPVHVGGRYLKLKRGIPQSPWFEGPRKLRVGESSVQVCYTNISCRSPWIVHVRSYFWGFDRTRYSIASCRKRKLRRINASKASQA
jgi:hypothetical protein